MTTTKVTDPLSADTYNIDAHDMGIPDTGGPEADGPDTRIPDTGTPNAGMNPAGSPQPTLAERIANWRYLGISAFLFAFLQTLCPAIIALSAVRVFIGLGALAAAAGTDAQPRGWHADWIRIPMMLLAALGTALNLFIIWHVRRLRARPAAQWRIAPRPAKTLRSERIQIALAVLTFVCLAAEWIIHPMMHHLHR